MPASDYWYEVIEDASLRQGDIFRGLAALQLSQELVLTNAPEAEQNVSYDVVRGDWILMDASCDIDYSDQRPAACQQVLLAAVYEASKETLKTSNDKEFNTRLEVMRRGLMTGRFLLPPHDGLQTPFPLSFVQYSVRVALPHAYLVSQAVGPRLRLKSPHRESYGAWVASCIGRVGPEDASQIPRFTPQLHAGQVVAADGAQ